MSKPKAVLRLWEVVGVDPTNGVLVIYNRSVDKYKDIFLSTGKVAEHPACHVEYIYPDEHDSKGLKKIEDSRDNSFRIIRED